MGIRFYCPNGHKLHVKEEQAGKRGICPHCKVRMRIPDKTDGVATDKLPTAERLPQEPTHVAEAPVKTPLNDDNAPTPPAPDPTPGNTRPYDEDPLDDPEALWYVRTLDNQEYGPATSAYFREWIEEVRILPDMLVCRNGWERWERAGDVFPELEKIVIPQDVTGQNDFAQNSGRLGKEFRYSEELTERLRRTRNHNKKLTRNLITIIILCAVIVALIAVLVVLLMQR